MDLISLIVLCLAIVAAFVFKANSGLVAMAAALVLGRCAGVGDKWLIGEFNNSLFIMLLGVMYLFCIAQDNKTLDLLAKKVLALCKGKVKLFPILLFLIAAILSAIGPGLIWPNLRNVSIGGNDLAGTHMMTYFVIAFAILAIVAAGKLPKEYDQLGRK